MADTNFLQWNPGQVNQETDAVYAADSSRVGGSVDNTYFPAELANKLFYQATTFVTAFARAMAGAGYANSDADVNVLQAVIANYISGAYSFPAIIVVPYSPTPSFNAGQANGFQMNLPANVNSSTVTGVTPGQLVAFYLQQDETGGRTFAWPLNMVGTIAPDPAPNAFSLQLFRADLSSTLHAIGPLVSNNGVFFGNLSVQGLSLGASSVGSLLVGNGTVYLPRTLVVNNVTGARSFGPTFQNTSGAAMTARVSGQLNQGVGVNASLLIQVGINAGGLFDVMRNSVENGPGWAGVSADIPSGWFYKVSTSLPPSDNRSLTLTSWVESTYA